MARNKVQVFKVEHEADVRLMKGTLRQVENTILAEHEIAPCSPEDAHKHADVEIEDVTGEP